MSSKPTGSRTLRVASWAALLACGCVWAGCVVRDMWLGIPTPGPTVLLLLGWAGPVAFVAVWVAAAVGWLLRYAFAPASPLPGLDAPGVVAGPPSGEDALEVMWRLPARRRAERNTARGGRRGGRR
jgi:hypothetical protein